MILLVTKKPNKNEIIKYFKVINELREKIFVPITLGGAVRSFDYARECFANGADKILINYLAHKNDKTMKKISNIIEDIENYPNVFKRITMARILDDDIAHVVLDMPFPFSSRDYIIQFVEDKSHTYWIFNFKAVTHNDAPVNDKYVRLLNAAGEWLIKPISNNETAIAYTWNGELLGDFPSWALPRAWKTQGNEIIDWLNEALSN